MSQGYVSTPDDYVASFTDEGFNPKDEGRSVPHNNDPEIIIEDERRPETRHQEEEEQEEYSEEREAQTRERPRKKKNNVQQRIDQMAYEKGTAEQYSTFLQQQLADREALLAQKQAEIQHYQESLLQQKSTSQELFTDKLKDREESIKKELRQAIENGDIDQQAEMTSQLADIKAERKTYLLHTHHEKQRQADAAYYSDQYGDYTPHETVLPQSFVPESPPQDYDALEWQQANPWYGKNAELTQEADQVAAELTRYCLVNNINVHPTDFRNKVASEIRLRYGGQANGQQSTYQDSYETSSPSPYIAPVTRGNNHMNNNPYNPNGMGHPAGKAPIRLTKEQYEFAKTLQSLPNETEAQKIARYARNIDPIPRNEEGTPIYKLRIG